MNKTLFEKLTTAGKPLTMRQSVSDNIERILSCGGFLDAAIEDNSEPGSVAPNSIYRSGMEAIVDQPGVNSPELDQYRENLVKLLLRFEPRLKNVTLNGFVNMGYQSACRLKIELIDGEFEQEFIFKQK